MSSFPTQMAWALRLGRRLVAEVSPTGPDRRAFVDINPLTTEADRAARREGWTRSDQNRTFRLQHWDYDTERLDTNDYDIDAMLVRSVIVVGEAMLLDALNEWGLDPEQFHYPWQTADPR